VSPDVSSDNDTDDGEEVATPLEEEGAAEQAIDHDKEGAMDFDDEESDHDQAGNNETAPHVYNLRQRRSATVSFRNAIDSPHSGKSYFQPHQLLQVDENDRSNSSLSDHERFIFEFMMTQLPEDINEYTQMSARKGIKKFGRLAEEALLVEFAQLEQYDVFEPVDPNTVSKSAKKGALRAINLIKKKKSGKIKGRTCADGRSQRNKYPKSETASRRCQLMHSCCL
jgi:hypothetical protein